MYHTVIWKSKQQVLMPVWALADVDSILLIALQNYSHLFFAPLFVL